MTIPLILNYLAGMKIKTLSRRVDVLQFSTKYLAAIFMKYSIVYLLAYIKLFWMIEQ